MNHFRPHQLLILLVLLGALPCAASGQVHLDLAGGASLPVGDYASNPAPEGSSAPDSDFAKLGYAGFAGIAIPLGQAFELFANAGIASHGLESSTSVPDELVSDVDLGRFRIHPFLAGGRIRIPAGGLTLFLDGSAGIALLKGPTISSPDFELSYDWTNTFAWAVGGGVFVNRRIGIGARFLPLGEVPTEVRLPEVPGLPETLEVQQSISFVDIYLNLRLN